MSSPIVYNPFTNNFDYVGEVGGGNQVVISRWLDEATDFDVEAGTGYYCIATLTAYLPPSAGLVNGAMTTLYIDTSSAVTLQANTGQAIEIGGATSVEAGKAVSTTSSTGSNVTLVFRIADLTWHAIGPVGTWTIT